MPIPGRPCLALPGAVMGIVNVTPDSFSDGGTCLDPGLAVAHGLALAAAGAAWLDVGGESSRPGATPVPAATEIARVVPVIAGLRRAGCDLPLSVDTCKAEVAAAALDAGAVLVNDISAGADPAMLSLVAQRGAGICLMHMQGTPATMQQAPRYRDVVAEVGTSLHAAMARACAAGIAAEAIVLDPGVGFGKTTGHNLALLAGLESLQALGRPLLLGVSRKRFVGELAGGIGQPVARDAASHLLHVQLFPQAALLRVHDVAGAVAARRLCLAAVRPETGDD